MCVSGYVKEKERVRVIGRERICVNKCSGCKGVDVNVYSIMISILRLFVAKAKVIEMY
jgi:hypothetical protein